MKFVQLFLLSISVAIGGAGLYRAGLSMDSAEVAEAIEDAVIPAVKPLLASQPGTATLLVFASLSDCPVCSKEAELWAEVSRQFDPQRLKVVVLMANASPAEVDIIQKRLGERIQVVPDDSGIVKRVQELIDTPAKALFEGEAIIDIDGSNYFEDEKLEWYRETVKILSEKISSSVVTVPTIQQ